MEASKFKPSIQAESCGQPPDVCLIAVLSEERSTNHYGSLWAIREGVRKGSDKDVLPLPWGDPSHHPDSEGAIGAHIPSVVAVFLHRTEHHRTGNSRNKF